MSLALVPATCVQDAHIGYIQDVMVFETLQIIVEKMTGSVPHVGHHHSHAQLQHRLVTHFHHVRQGVQHTLVERQWHRQQTDRTKYLPQGTRQSAGHSEESKLMAQSRSPNIQNYTLVQHDRCIDPGASLLFVIHNSLNFSRKPLSTT